MRPRTVAALMLSLHVAAGAQDRDAAAAHARAGATALAARNWAAAEQEYGAALRLEPDVAELASNLGLSLYFQKKFDAAAQLFERALHRAPDLFVPNLFLGRLRIDQGRGAEAVPYLEKCARSQPANALIRRLLASGLVARGDRQLALEQLREAVRLEPNTMEAWYSLSKVSMDLARVWMEKAAGHPTEGKHYRNLILARSFEEQGATETAKNYYRALGQSDPAAANGEAQRNAVTLFEAGNVELAASRFLDLLRAHPNDPQAAYWLGRCYERTAQEAMRRMVDLAPDSHRVHQLNAELAMEQGRSSDAIAHYTKALAQKPNDRALVFGLGQAFMKDGQLQAAIAQFEKVIAQDPRDASATLNIARCYLALKDSRRAYEHARRASSIDPKLLQSYGVMGRALAIEDRTAEAVLELEKAAPSDTDGSVHYQLFLAYRKLNEAAKAQVALRRSTELRSHNRQDYLEEVGIRAGAPSPSAAK
ncbi:MAG: tetratricopeptide repeat protein [Bryobacteraceae bacterium]